MVSSSPATMGSNEDFTQEYSRTPRTTPKSAPINAELDYIAKLTLLGLFLPVSGTLVHAHVPAVSWLSLKYTTWAPRATCANAFPRQGSTAHKGGLLSPVQGISFIPANVDITSKAVEDILKPTSLIPTTVRERYWILVGSCR